MSREREKGRKGGRKGKRKGGREGGRRGRERARARARERERAKERKSERARERESERECARERKRDKSALHVFRDAWKCLRARPLARAHFFPASRRILKGADCSIEKITLSAAVPPSVTVRYA